MVQNKQAVLYGMKCLTLKIQCKNEVSITKMRMLCWMGGKTRRDKIRKDTI